MRRSDRCVRLLEPPARPLDQLPHGLDPPRHRLARRVGLGQRDRPSAARLHPLERRQIGLRAVVQVAEIVVHVRQLDEPRPPIGLREPPVSESQAAEASYASMFGAVSSAMSGALPGLRAIFVSTLLLQLTFQTFTTWFALHATERFGLAAEEATFGFIAWALGGVLGSVPAGIIGTRIGRRPAMLFGFGLMAACLLAVDRVASFGQAVPCWFSHRPAGRCRR